MSYFDSRWMTIYFDEPLQAVGLTWKAYAEGEEFRLGFSRGVELLKQRALSRWLGDCRLQGPITQADQKWMHEVWHPQAVAAGMRWIALVSPKAAVARLSMKSIVTRVHSAELVFNHFDDMDSARAWLRAPHRP